MRISTAFYAGVGTVVVAIIAGVGGGLFVGKITSPPRPTQGTKLEQPVSASPIASATASPQPQDVLKQDALKQDILKQPDVPQPAYAPPSAYAAPAREGSKPSDAYAKARDSDLNRSTTKRTAERHRQQAAERRFRDEPRRNKEARNIGPRMREGARDPTDPRNFIERPVGIEMPGISVSSSDNDE
jgi:hypothetical protein